MLTTETLDKTISLLKEGYTYPSITEEIGITSEEASVVGIAYFKNETEQLFREVQLADVLELVAMKLRSGEGWEEATTGDVVREIWHVFPEHVTKALALALLSAKL
jgi:hypothetical protein